MATYRITSDHPERASRVGIRQLLNRGGAFDAIIIDSTGAITVVSDEALPRLAAFLNVEQLDDAVTAVDVVQEIVDSKTAQGDKIGKAEDVQP